MLAMLVTMGAVITLALFDQRAQSELALHDLAREQAVLASSVAKNMEGRLTSSSVEHDVDDEKGTIHGRRISDEQYAVDLLSSTTDVERRGAVVILLQLPGRLGLVAADGRVMSGGRIEEQMRLGASETELSRDEAAAFGLPARRAVAGLANATGADGRVWGVVTLSSAQQMRDRQRRSDWRLALGTLAVAMAVIAFGGAALVLQRKELELVAELGRRDVERERDEQLVRADKMATLAALSTGITHEIATPLGVIVARLDPLRSRLRDDERGIRNVEIISEQVERIERVMRGFLAIARGDAPVLERVDASRVADGAVSLVRHRFEKAGVALELEAETHMDVAVDPPVFEQALVNLLLNACYASAEHGQRVVLSVFRHDERIVFAVRDLGLGMPADVAMRAVEPFFTTKPVGSGTGLGLSIANEIVKHHGGTLSISSSSTTERAPALAHGTALVAERGTTVRVELPIVNEVARDTR